MTEHCWNCGRFMRRVRSQMTRVYRPIKDVGPWVYWCYVCDVGGSPVPPDREPDRAANYVIEYEWDLTPKPGPVTAYTVPLPYPPADNG